MSPVRFVKRWWKRHDRVLRSAAEQLLGREDLTAEEREHLDGALHALDACEHHAWLLIVPVNHRMLLYTAEQAILPIWVRHMDTALFRQS